jgi:rRNA-processing protein FCF1
MIWSSEIPLPSKVLIDTNILLLLLVGSTDRAAVTRFKRTKKFLPEDFDIAVNFLTRFSHIATTSSIMTETSNLASELSSPLLGDVFLKFIEWVNVLEERYLPGRDIVADAAFTRFGFTDGGISALRDADYLVLTDDFRLSQYLQSEGVPAINFNHMRAYLALNS